MRGKEQCTFDQIALLLSKNKLQLVGRLSTDGLLEFKKSAYEDEIENEKEEDISSTEVEDNAPENEWQDIDHAIPHKTRSQELPVTATIQDRYQLPSTKWKKRIDGNRDNALATSSSDTDVIPSSSRMSLKEHDEVLIIIAICVLARWNSVLILKPATGDDGKTRRSTKLHFEGHAKFLPSVHTRYANPFGSSVSPT